MSVGSAPCIGRRARLDAHGEVADEALLAAIAAGMVQLVALGAAAMPT